MEDQAFVSAMRSFSEWALRQSPDIYEQVLAHIQTISAVLANQRIVVGPTYICPDYWAMAEAAAALQYLAEAVGFVEAARYCQEAYEAACAGCALIGPLLGGDSGRGEGGLAD